MRPAVTPKGRPCVACCHPDLKAIDAELLTPGIGLAAIAARFPPCTRPGLSRHRAHHIAELLKEEAVQAHVADEIDHGISLTDRIGTIYQRAEGLLAAMEAEKDHRGAVTAIKELRGCVELMAKLAGQIDQGATINVFNGPAWVSVQTNVLAALAPYPDARAAVARALDVPVAIEAT